ncbi:vacuolar protein sorting-associated protein 26B [Neophocaena asiaeorientalis asiaeorientalis]|uniref:Vacuolar protein sorting-associated protein 26B n=1 Tax=Neophocaena asiaeorientalis asiaeorientalis TaxID=1706337 RepID=A0A341CDT4_NEOAA|nr:vacuolar protein sorting-associated protein 26B [Neophocaena asiaeorientalis asiaeorientalis]
MTAARLNFQSCSGARAEKTQRAQGDTGLAPTNYRAPPVLPLANQQGLPPHAQRVRRAQTHPRSRGRAALLPTRDPGSLFLPGLRCCWARPQVVATESRGQSTPFYSQQQKRREYTACCPSCCRVPMGSALTLGAPSPGHIAQGLVEVVDALPAELYYDRGNHHEFVSLVKDLARPGEVTQSQAFDFEFTHVEKPYESYTGQNVKLRYFLRATISRRLNDVVKEMDIVVHTLSTYPELNSSIKMEVGIEDCLHIEFEYNKSKYHLKDVIVGKIYFLLVRIKIKHMEIDIIKRETTGTGPNVYHENDTIAKYEIMDGAPVRGESIPIRLFLAGYELTPTMRDINKKFSVRYYLNLVLIDEEERRYFKQQVSPPPPEPRPPRQNHRASSPPRASKQDGDGG